MTQRGMDFFEAQDRARRRTKWLLLYFAFAVVGIILSVHCVVSFSLHFTGRPGLFWDRGVFGLNALGTGLLIFGGTLYKSMHLARGGAVIAEDLGGRRVDPATGAPDERKLLNVVQEMAIASGMPVPQVYVMDGEMGINAFAAGTDPSNAVIGVTRGCMDVLSRAELQGVVAHEFSHILNGDMRLNMRLIQVIFGILILTIIGRTILYSMRPMGLSRRSSREGGGAIAAILLLGLGFIIVGGVGSLFARLLQAAVSRQREFLADSSAVQFTREPAGLAGALKKIGGWDDGATMRSPKALEASHMFFAEGGMFNWGLATHPPLEVRIRALQPHWEGGLEKAEAAQSSGRSARAGSSLVASLSGEGGSSQQGAGVRAFTALSNLGAQEHCRLEVGSRLREGIRPRWLKAAENRDEAKALVFSMLLSPDEEAKKIEMDGLRQAMGSEVTELAGVWREEQAVLHSTDRIALIDLCLPTLRHMSPPEYERFMETTRWLISLDGKVDLFEFMLQHALARNLGSHFEQRGFPPVRHCRLSDLAPHANVLLTVTARMGRQEEEAVSSFRAAAEDSGSPVGWKPSLLGEDECSPELLHSALAEFEAATPLVKKQILRACGLAAAEDGVLTSGEAELLRALGDAIGASLPPFVSELEKNENRPGS